MAGVIRLGDVVFPTIEPYHHRVVHEYGVSSDRVVRLPIASNIPAVTLSSVERTQLRQGLGWNADDVVAVTFGTQPSQARAIDWFAPLLAQGVREGIVHRVICVGGDDPVASAKLADQVRQSPLAGVFQMLGPQSARRVGEVLACSDFAFLPTCRRFIEKSGAFMACAAAGLAVLVPPPTPGPGLDTGRLPILAAESWDWRLAKSAAVAQLRCELREHARQQYDWDAIAGKALDRLTVGQLSEPGTLNPESKEKRRPEFPRSEGKPLSMR
jgi:hypothetical protein